MIHFVLIIGRMVVPSRLSQKTISKLIDQTSSQEVKMTEQRLINQFSQSIDMTAAPALIDLLARGSSIIDQDVHISFESMLEEEQTTDSSPIRSSTVIRTGYDDEVAEERIQSDYNDVLPQGRGRYALPFQPHGRVEEHQAIMSLQSSRITRQLGEQHQAHQGQLRQQQRVANLQRTIRCALELLDDEDFGACGNCLLHHEVQLKLDHDKTYHAPVLSQLSCFDSDAESGDISSSLWPSIHFASNLLACYWLVIGKRWRQSLCSKRFCCLDLVRTD